MNNEHLNNEKLKRFYATKRWAKLFGTFEYFLAQTVHTMTLQTAQHENVIMTYRLLHFTTTVTTQTAEANYDALSSRYLGVTILLTDDDIKSF